MSKWTAGVLGALALGCAGAGHAATYLLDVDDCVGAGCGLSSYGTVTVTPGGAGGLHIAVDLANGVYFDQGDNGWDAVAFDAMGSPITTTGISGDFFAYSPHTAQSHLEGPAAPNALGVSQLGGFSYVVDWDPRAGTTPQIGQLAFDISAGSLTSTASNDQPIYFAVDVKRATPGGTVSGVIGATLGPNIQQAGVPEPAAWALTIMGFGAVGAGLRRRVRALAA
ncbi:MAG TPA: PEPxxWA-CTERM sorting domain-containing protein [Phenylobacterium sp.]|uniref:PEPxxWA-CTERM sorting domain-containing protein n=1 Tax=Phenylobacterium sp. TaxID=1871053 RepID=UPI002CC93E8D|nr:PEPxxWA-CTERM sorting domain-containing protein [Phenylobacterium sp.]HXA40474.1 PEPxxWA-CTERM sorting domain-containing protein [Phenylobacterium sp.]